MLLAGTSFTYAGNDPALEAALHDLVAEHKGDVAIAIRQLDGPVEYYRCADTPMRTASLIKFPVMLTAYHQVAQRKICLDDLVTLREEDKVPGSGILTEHFSAGTKIPLRDAIHLMVVFSDNTATNLVLEEIGIPATAQYMESLGFEETKINAKVYRGSTTSIDPERTEKYGLGSTTAREMATLFAQFERGELASSEATEAMKKHLLACEDHKKIARFLPDDVKYAHKTGSVNAARCDAGILYLPDATVAICVLTNNNQDESWSKKNDAEILCGKIGKAVVERFAQ